MLPCPQPPPLLSCSLAVSKPAGLTLLERHCPLRLDPVACATLLSTKFYVSALLALNFAFTPDMAALGGAGGGGAHRLQMFLFGSWWSRFTFGRVISLSISVLRLSRAALLLFSV